MTKQWAIRTLRGLHLLAEEQEAKEAILMAIKALKQPEIVHCKDCKHSRPDDSFNFCYRCDFTPGYCHFESGFCERGEAKGQPKDDPSHPFADDVLMALMGGDDK